jgi:hypothetical protein
VAYDKVLLPTALCVYHVPINSFQREKVPAVRRTFSAKQQKVYRYVFICETATKQSANVNTKINLQQAGGVTA